MAKHNWDPWPYDTVWQSGDKGITKTKKDDEGFWEDRGMKIPVTQGIPWLFNDPFGAFAEWQLKFQGSLAQIVAEGDQINQELKGPETVSRKRLSKMLQAKREQVKLLQKIMAPFSMVADPQPSQHMLTPNQVANSQKLLGYFDNVFRDWCWGEEENQKSLEMIKDVCHGSHLGKTLVIGAGACRLPYDIFQEGLTNDLTVLDINPLLFLIARRVMSGKKVQLYEFPLAPINSESFAKLQTLKAPEPVGPGFKMLLADGLEPPVGGEQYDTVITPWFVDIVHEPFEGVGARVNRLLKPDGSWINFGSLAFFHRNYTHCYARDEIPHLLEGVGFGKPKVVEERLPYLASPLSCQQRQELLLAFCVNKISSIGDVKNREAAVVPDWLAQTDVKVPVLPDFPNQLLANRLFVDVIGRVDGHKTLSQLAEEIAPLFNFQHSQGIALLKQVLGDLYEKSLKSPQFR